MLVIIYVIADINACKITFICAKYAVLNKGHIKAIYFFKCMRVALKSPNKSTNI